MRGERIDRLSHEFQQEIAMILQQELKHPGLGFVTVTRVELSKDVAYAKVFYSCLGSAAERASSHAALSQSAGYIRSLLKKRFRLKVIPEISFRYDESIAGAITMTDALEQLNRPQHPEGSEEA